MRLCRRRALCLETNPRQQRCCLERAGTCRHTHKAPVSGRTLFLAAYTGPSYTAARLCLGGLGRSRSDKTAGLLRDERRGNHRHKRVLGVDHVSRDQRLDTYARYYLPIRVKDGARFEQSNRPLRDRDECRNAGGALTAHVSSSPVQPFSRQYIASADGQRFLVDTLKEQTVRITVVLNWKPAR